VGKLRLRAHYRGGVAFLGKSLGFSEPQFPQPEIGEGGVGSAGK
jgi:hypothetical protein